jgi:hypothetical protein
MGDYTMEDRINPAAAAEFLLGTLVRKRHAVAFPEVINFSLEVLQR